MINGELQAFEIWYHDDPKLTFDDARKACGSESRHQLAKKIFFSKGWAFQRWLITSGFQEFVETTSVTPCIDREGEPGDESERDKTLEVLERLWMWMKQNEKTIN